MRLDEPDVASGFLDEELLVWHQAGSELVGIQFYNAMSSQTLSHEPLLNLTRTQENPVVQTIVASSVLSFLL